MRLTTRGRYAVTALLDLAIQDGDSTNAVSLSDIAKRQSISISYLEQLFSKLRKAGLVTSTRGASGGYHLAKPLADIDVMTIITAVDESVNAMQCGGQGNCQGGAMCLTHDLWCALSKHIEQYLKNISLEQLLQMENVKDVSDRQQLIYDVATESTTSHSNPNMIFSASEVNPA
ncbi:Rrf2 family transcriptional regulator [Psychrobacter sp. YP14]|jgi:Rrf2 family iron-sulfur cluster assembly transcriptional regulator|uniref:Rrf2 family transcriptional regulator n=3 Tax=Psychrobacter TaxID=497 RepID=A0A844LZP5_9GAMM|nr:MULTISPECIES: Rrf2 family transcriptional regulator [Psychrobacter]AWT49372.1 Rrf2 family transcriptional regulator [Psychrobacter sp. YP14]MUG32161.1 Rrf2 family transcriptional regulator [Psychrobacter sanguinis]UNK04700.1 Rrf2 family transcriptional regulator [Psychrobacter sp. PraFG1]